MSQDLSKEELWNIKRMNQRAKSMGGKVEVVWDTNGEIEEIYVSGRIAKTEIYHVENTLDHPNKKKIVDSLE